MKIDMKQMIKRLLAGKGGNESKIKAYVKAWYEMRERGDPEGKAYMEKLLAKWRTDREK
jgi:hypothetical protein